MANTKMLRKILDAFPTDVPSRAILCAALEGSSKARLITDESAADPVSSGAVIALGQNGTMFVGRGVSQAFFQSKLAELRQKQRLVLTMTRRQESEYAWDWLSDRRVVERYEHADLDMDVVIRHAKQAAEHRSFVPIDAELFRRCVWHDEMSSMLGDEAQFLEHGVGICQMEGDEIVTEAYAIVSDCAGAEIGGITHESYRRAGNAVATCAHLVVDHLARRRPIYWCCDQDNIASARTAKRLGFRDRREYRFIIVPASG